MLKILVISVLIVIAILIAFVVAVTKGYSYKHTIDPIENNPNLKKDDKDDHKADNH